MKCKHCGREMPNNKWKTSNGCLWCDIQNWYKPLHLDEKSGILITTGGRMKKVKVQVIKKIIKSTSHFSAKKNKETIYYHIYVGKDGKKYCIDGDTLK